MNNILIENKKSRKVIDRADELGIKYVSIRLFLPFHSDTLLQARNGIDEMITKNERLNECGVHYYIIPELYDISVVIIPNNKESMTKLLLSDEIAVDELRNKCNNIPLLHNIVIKHIWSNGTNVDIMVKCE